MPGASCKYKDGTAYKDSRGFWRAPCSCGAVSPGFKIKTMALRWQRQHKNEDELALPHSMRQAIVTLSDHGLIQGDHARLRPSIK